jgi:nitrogen fixation NifU-like protein
MAERGALYQQTIVDHARNPRNFRAMDNASARAEGHNPLCGDHLSIYVRIEGDRLADVAFTGSGCAISKSSASLMTTVLPGKTRTEAMAIFAQFLQMITVAPGNTAEGGCATLPGEEGGCATFSGELETLEALRSVREYPVRVKCATLAWHTLAAAIEGGSQTVTTE